MNSVTAGLRADIIDDSDVVVINENCVIWSVPVTRPTTVYSNFSLFKANTSCPVSVTLT